MTTTILKFEYGSRAHGTHTIDSDTDLMGVFVEPREFITGISQIDTMTEKTAPEGARSTATDTDYVAYPLRKWARLAAHGNPTVLTALFAPEYLIKTSSGGLLVDSAEVFLSKEAGSRFLGYMKSQRDAMTGLKNKHTNRPELIHTHGFDTKFAYHMLRLGLQGIELMKTGTIQLPMAEDDRELLLSIRRGERSREEVLLMSIDVEIELESAIKASTLQDHPDTDKINTLLHYIYTNEWDLDD